VVADLQQDARNNDPEKMMSRFSSLERVRQRLGELLTDTKYSALCEPK
jgi:hypothetical protein